MAKGVGLMIVLLFFSTLSFCQKVFNVLEFGAKGDGINDDSKAINDCILMALKEDSSVIYFPKGTYLCMRRINLEVTRNQTIVLEGNSSSKVKPLLTFKNVDQDKGIYARGNNLENSLGNVKIINLRLEGPGLGIGKNNSYYNTVRHMYGIGASNLAFFSVIDCEVVSFYGNGIDVSNKVTRRKGASSRFINVDIRDCYIIDCWGKSPTDSYGDGVYLADCLKFSVINNVIQNNQKRMGELGRAGLVIEDFTSNGEVSRNEIDGYSRGIHIENSLGGLVVSNNKILNNSIAVLLWSDGINSQEDNVIIENNILSSRLLKGNKKKDKIIVLKIERKGNVVSKDIVRNNILKMNGFSYNELDLIKVNSTNTNIYSNKFKK